jgi:hypothetical protein
MSDKKKVLVLYYTQTGQLKNILDHILGPILQEADFTFMPIEPVTPFPWPWSKQEFFDAMPETVVGDPRPVKNLPIDTNTHYDLIILGYQPWFLSPSQPIAAFLQSEQAKQLLKGKPVLTILGSRNMWLNAQEKTKKYLKDIGAALVGNIVLVDKSPNLVSLITVLRWTGKGKKEAFFIFPPAGVQERDIVASKRFAPVILDALQKGNFDNLQNQLLALDAVELLPSLIVLENRGKKPFQFFAQFIRKKGGPGASERQSRVVMYRVLLLTAIPFLSPFTTIASKLQLWFTRKKLEGDVQYYKGVSYRESNESKK